MKLWALGLGLFLVTVPSLGNAQEDCPSGRPSRLIPTINPALGQSPMWVVIGSGPIPWKGSNHPVQALWIRDVAVKGPAFLSGTVRAGKAKASFATALYGLPGERFKLDELGEKPRLVKEADLRRYSFHRTYVWFPTPGCYEITARVGRQVSVIYLSVTPAAEKDR